MSPLDRLTRWVQNLRSSKMADNQKPFKATHTFTHKYTREHILRKYLIDTAKLTTEQFRMQVSFVLSVHENPQILTNIQTEDNNLGLEITDETVKLEEVSLICIDWLYRMR